MSTTPDTRTVDVYPEGQVTVKTGTYADLKPGDEFVGSMYVGPDFTIVKAVFRVERTSLVMRGYGMRNLAIVRLFDDRAFPASHDEDESVDIVVK